MITTVRPKTKNNLFILSSNSENDISKTFRKNMTKMFMSNCLEFSMNTSEIIEVYDIEDNDLTKYSLNLAENSLHEDWKDEDDEHWNSFLR